MDALNPRHDDAHCADRRMRELYRYFRLRGQSTLSSSVLAEDAALPEARAPADTPGTAATTTVVDPDALVLDNSNKTLNSFAQLAALQLNVERALIAVSDRDSQFILAEATKASNINGSTKRAFDEDGLWSGSADAAWSVYEATIRLPPFDRNSSQCSFLVVDDLSEDERFKRLPFVQGVPHFRFYAGIPLTTDNGINIGCLFVLDEEPRLGLTDAQRETLGSIATLVVDYLRISRQAADGRRATRLSRGLSCFVEGSSSFADNLKPPRPTSLSSIPPSGNLRPSLSPGSRSSIEGSRRSVSSDTHSVGSLPEYRSDQCTSPGLTTPLPDWWPGKGGPQLDEFQENALAFRRAANLLRESLELGNDGGVIFLEASNMLGFGNDYSDAGSPAPLLAISTTEEPFSPQPGSRCLYPAANLGAGFLHQLLQRYAKGKLWSFHRDGMASSSDEDGKRNSRYRPARPIGIIGSNNKKWKQVENIMLNRYFPGASQVIFVPLWNAANSQWFGGCFCWNTVETHVFSSAVDLSSVLGFGTSVMAECSRVESQIADRQKGDFIGSISHELRSPLHGILAAIEFLNSTSLSEFQGSLLETANSCGRTLLDTMNQVLDFSKIVSLERQWRHRRTKELPQDLPAPDRLSHLDSSVPFDLAILTEEVVEGVCLGHAYGRWTNSTDQVAMFQTAPNQLSLQNRMYQSEVEVAIDIAQNDWVYQAQPGALRRIIMNVFGNALKYTDTGRVSIHLSRAEADENIGTGEDLITLVVSDTGKGMSQVFLSERLYTPFAQEDSMAAGTGLGLSIVRSLVKALNGSIRIHSRPGEGTAVKITLSLGRGEATPTVESPEANRLTSRPSHKAARAAILGVDIESTSRPVWGVIAQYLTEWYGLELVSWPSQHPIDILLTDEQKLSVTPTGTVPALLILSSQTADQDALRTKWSSVASYVDIVHPPCGPHKLGKSISKITDSLKRGTHITTLPERPPPPPPGPVRSKKPPPPDTPVHRSCTTHPTPRILLVDDNAINLNLIHTFLRKQHLTTFHTATNGSDAVTAVSESNQSYDIIFMDMSMPIMDGFEATRAIREIEREKGTGRRATIIALTGLSSSRDEEDALGSGVDLFLTKPVSLKEVGRYLTEWRERVE